MERLLLELWSYVASESTAFLQNWYMHVEAGKSTICVLKEQPEAVILLES